MTDCERIGVRNGCRQLKRNVFCYIKSSFRIGWDVKLREFDDADFVVTYCCDSDVFVIVCDWYGICNARSTQRIDRKSVV